MKKLIIICGAPCSGKGTQSMLLAKNLGYKHISTGDLIRNSTREDLKEIIATGNLVSDAQMLELLDDAFKSGGNIILDGYPRTRQQFINLIDITDKYEYHFENVFYIMVNESLLLERMVSRNEGRSDDDPEKFETRLKTFRNATRPTIETYLSVMPGFERIRGEQSIEEVFDEISFTLSK
jgi:adenylate kinase family enzyme